MRAPFLAALAVAGAGVGSVLLGACGSRTVPGTGGEVGEAVSALAAPHPPGSKKLLADGLPPGMARFRGGGPDQASSPVCNNPQITYFGGPVLQSPTIVAVFWTSTVAAAVQANMGQFYADITQSSYWSWLQEYGTVGKSPGTNQAILPGTFGGGFVISPLICAPGGTNCKLSDAQLQAELVRQIDMGVLPAPTLDCTGNANTLYMVSFPPNISLGGPQGAGRSCVNNGFCGYHNTGTYGTSSTPLIYAALMDVFTGPCKDGCGGNALALDNATDLASHELVEAATDADIGLDFQNEYAAPAAWGDNNNQCGEVGDICDDGSPGDTVTVSGRKWVVQQIWSQAQGKCTSTGPAAPICTSTTVTGCRPCSCGDDGLACHGATAVCETDSSNVLYGACEACTASNATCGSGTCLQSTTPSQDDICSNCSPATACPAGDDCGTVSDGCGGTLSCGTCTAPQTCGGGSPSNPNACGCSPLLKCPANVFCGTIPDGCGGTVSCGNCTPPTTCGGGGVAGQCGAACTPLTCAQQGLTCGAAKDGCGNVLDCGTCNPPATCGGGGVAGQCGASICDPLTCSQLGAQCGMIGDGCGDVLHCGTCPSGQTCGGGGVANVCGSGGGCLPKTCAQQGLACGLAGDGCGGELNCGTCPAGQSCGGSGIAGQCGGCTPKTCVQQGLDCGSAGDGCGNALDCGVCPSGQTCGGNGIAGQCGCAPLVACPMGEVCGTETDGCGGLITCGTCASDQVCAGHACVPGSSTTSSSSSTSTTSTSTSTSVSSSSSSGGEGGSPATTTSSGSGEWIPIYGRACAAAPGDAPGGGSAAWLGLGLLGLTGVGARRRNRRSANP